jgi:hypothetical protein
VTGLLALGGTRQTNECWAKSLGSHSVENTFYREHNYAEENTFYIEHILQKAHFIENTFCSAPKAPGGRSERRGSDGSRLSTLVDALFMDKAK